MYDNVPVQNNGMITHLCKTQWYKCHVVCCYHRIKQHLLHTIIKISFQHLHFISDYIWRQCTAVIQNRLLLHCGYMWSGSRRSRSRCWVTATTANVTHFWNKSICTGYDRTRPGQVTLIEWRESEAKQDEISRQSGTCAMSLVSKESKPLCFV